MRAEFSRDLLRTVCLLSLSMSLTILNTCIVDFPCSSESLSSDFHSFHTFHTVGISKTTCPLRSRPPNRTNNGAEPYQLNCTINGAEPNQPN
ncbi:hypothetical protein BpHYR1_008179, partial [Brachionus plicatilis]